ncbi:MAG: sel1 repeat family protein [Salinarimonas sp.]|nr:sel1 repeat family protein [Salinarimonas sp.]
MARTTPRLIALVFLSAFALSEQSDAQHIPPERRSTPFIMPEAAIAEARRDAENGDIEAQLWLGTMYYNYASLPQEFAKAEHWWRQAAEQGNATGQYGLGLLYRMGDGVVQDYAEAARWFRKGALQDHLASMNSLGNLYARGLVTPPEGAEPTDWLQRAQEKRIETAERRRASNYESRSRGDSANAAKGDFSAQFSIVRLATSYAEGKHWFPKDNVRAYKWFTIARMGPALKRDELGERMSPEEIAEAERLAREWWSEHR